MAKPSAFARLKEAEAPPPPPPQSAAAPMTGPVTRDGFAARNVQPSRVGKKTVIFYDDPKVVKALKQVGLDTDRTIQDMMQEAVDDFLVKNGRHAFGKR